MNSLLLSTLHLFTSPFLLLRFLRRATFKPWGVRLPWEGSGADNLRSYFFSLPPPAAPLCSHIRALMQAGMAGTEPTKLPVRFPRNPRSRQGQREGWEAGNKEKPVEVTRVSLSPRGSRGTDACRCQPVPCERSWCSRGRLVASVSP